MRVGRPAANLANLRVQSPARSAAQLITASRDPPGTLGAFLTTFVDGLRPPSGAAPPSARPPLATRSTRKS
jgi:hypothetical protein